jgi:hypothetical protein
MEPDLGGVPATAPASVDVTGAGLGYSFKTLSPQVC